MVKTRGMEKVERGEIQLNITETSSALNNSQPTPSTSGVRGRPRGRGRGGRGRGGRGRGGHGGVGRSTPNASVRAQPRGHQVITVPIDLSPYVANYDERRSRRDDFDDRSRSRHRSRHSGRHSSRHHRHRHGHRDHQKRRRDYASSSEFDSDEERNYRRHQKKRARYSSSYSSSCSYSSLSPVVQKPLKTYLPAKRTNRAKSLHVASVPIPVQESYAPAKRTNRTKSVHIVSAPIPVPAKRTNRTKSVHVSFPDSLPASSPIEKPKAAKRTQRALTIDVPTKRTLPWLPEIPPFKPGVSGILLNGGKRMDDSTAKRPPPNLLPIATTKSTTELQQNEQQAEVLQTQISLNAKLMKEVDALKEERSQLLKTVEQSNKEKEVLKMKLVRSSEQLEYLKKKLAKKHDENIDPNFGAINAIQLAKNNDVNNDVVKDVVNTDAVDANTTK
ncbi:ATP-dependent RNA helicase ddx46-like [Contarinia nasturtii]|uniref:ATP-dependent RNA helicase ddx46-like n=1 Tax=Contarinia nasturtii TaxID=265458 RepID=UPI0012D4177E|nr:ATP-dependent RNA helicase ddx46-like [Contarinia nasturtii]